MTMRPETNARTEQIGQPRGATPGLWASSCGRLGIMTVLLVLASALAPSQAQADEVKVSGSWIAQVEVVGMAGGRVTWITRTGTEISRPLSDLEGIRLDAIPEIARANEALEKGDGAAAAALYNAAFRKATQEWLKAYLQMLQVQAYDHAGDFRSAMRVYQTLLRSRVDPYFVSKPPLSSVNAASEADRQDAISRLEGMLRAAGPARAGLETYIATLKASLQGQVVVDPTRPVDLAAVADSDMAMPKDMDLREPITVMLVQGKYREALEAADAQLRVTSANLSLRLYQRGMALMALARAEDDISLYKDAGLAFMRILVYRGTTAHTGAATMEVGAVHARLGRLNKARELYDRASILIDQEEDPRLYARLDKLRGELSE